MALRNVALVAAITLSACGTAGKSDASAGAAKPETVAISNPWAQPIAADGKSAAVYMSIESKCPADDVLESVTATAPLDASLHASADVDNALVMTPVKSIPVPCGKPALLKPMGMHVMVMGIQKPIGIGDQIPLTLHFKRGGAVPVNAEVTTMAVLENVDPLNMHGKHGAGGMKMDHGTMGHMEKH